MRDDGSDAEPRLKKVHPLWRAPYRSLFLFASLCALLTPLVWFVPGDLGPDPASWHAHEMMFGMGGAAVGGYILTALPAWTRCTRPSTGTTVLLSILWCGARLSYSLQESLPLPLVVAGTIAYFIALSALLTWRLLGARSWRTMWAVAAVTTLGLADAAVVARSVAFDDHRAAVLVILLFALLIGVIGGRAVPAFTRHWLARSADSSGVTDLPALRIASIVGVLAAGLFVGLAEDGAAGACLIISGALPVARMAGWRSRDSARYPALLMLHVSWAWLPLGLLLTGLALVSPAFIDETTALHALTMGAMGTMIFAIMARAAMERSEGLLRVSPLLMLGFALVWLSGLIRVLGPLLVSDLFAIAHTAATIWMLGWVSFLVIYARALGGSVPRPVLSAS